MFLAELLCSDEDCAVTAEAVADLGELELLVCEDCGCCLVILSLSAHEAARVQPRPEHRLAA